jgi:cytochrome oxidase Cu insertion factor (SCO1/SenC/PrrC family)
VLLVSPPASTWGAGDRRAPDFLLSDQDGRPVSVAANRGRPVIVTFIDPLCRNFCPLEAQVLNQAERQIPAAHRPAIVAVSVDVYANARRYLLQDDREWRLVPEWRWAVGLPGDLAAVWKNYRIGVKVATRRINGTITYRIDHTEAAYVLDATGHERAMFLWPFNPQDLEQLLRQLA